jgi:hypothetical protein
MKKHLLSFFALLFFEKIIAQTVDFPFLESARSLAIANATTALVSQNSVMSNPATMAFLFKKKVVSAAISTPYFLENWKKVTLSASVPAGNSGHFGATLARSGTSDFIQNNLRFAYGRLLAPKLSVGASADFSTISVPDYGKTSTISVGFGLFWRPKAPFHFGFILQNPTSSGWKTGESRSPNIRSGATWIVNPQVQFFAEMEKDLRNKTILKIALEYQILGKFALRSGIRNAPFRWAFGGGYRLQKGISIDFATEWNPNLGITPAASVGWEFEKKRKIQK